MTSLLCDFSIRGKSNKRFQGEREGEREWVLQNRIWARKVRAFFFFKGSIDTSITFWSIFFVFRSHGQMLKCLTSHLETFYLFFEGNRL